MQHHYHLLLLTDVLLWASQDSSFLLVLGRDLCQAAPVKVGQTSLDVEELKHLYILNCSCLQPKPILDAAGAPGWHRSGNMKICRWCYPRLPVITPGMTLVSTTDLLMVKRSSPSPDLHPNGLAVHVIGFQQGKDYVDLDPETRTLCFLQSNVQSNMLGPSVLPELATRRKAWEQAHTLAAEGLAWPAEHSKEAARSQPNASAIGDDMAAANIAPSTAAAQAAACELFTMTHPPSLISSSSLDNAPAEEPATGHLQTPSIVQNRCKRYERADMPSMSADKSNSRLLDRGISHVRDKGKKSAAFVAEKHISEAPRPIPSDNTEHPKQPAHHHENGYGIGGVKKLTAKVLNAFRLH